MTDSEHHIRNFEIQVKPDQAIAIRIGEPEYRAEGLSLTTWTSSYLLARLLPSLSNIEPDHDLDERTIPVLELGAGTGLVGLTAAFTWNTAVVLTDLEPIVPGLAHNIALNKSLFANSEGVAHAHLSCGGLDWRDPPVLNLYSRGINFEKSERIPQKANVILAADTVYSEEHPELLSKAILTWLAPGNKSRAIIMYAMRVAYLDQIRELWQLLEDGGLESIGEGQERADEKDNKWDDELLCEWSIWKWKDNISTI
jgi:predicted nicotinamide N-methyase